MRRWSKTKLDTIKMSNRRKGAAGCVNRTKKSYNYTKQRLNQSASERKMKNSFSLQETEAQELFSCQFVMDALMQSCAQTCILFNRDCSATWQLLHPTR